MREDVSVKKIAIALLLGCSLVACGDKAAEKKDDKGGSGSASGEIGIAECDDYIKKMDDLFASKEKDILTV